MRTAATTVTATYKGEQVHLGFTVDLDMRTRLTLHIEPVQLRASHAAKVARLAAQDVTLTGVTVNDLAA